MSDIDEQLIKECKNMTVLGKCSNPLFCSESCRLRDKLKRTYTALKETEQWENSKKPSS